MSKDEGATPLTHLYEKALHARHPLWASIELTYTCNLACSFCYNPVQRKNQKRTAPVPTPSEAPLSFDEIIGILDQFKDLGMLYPHPNRGRAVPPPAVLGHRPGG